MKRAYASLVVFLLLAIMTSCATVSAGGGSGASGGSVITEAELEQYPGEELLGLILRARRTWLETRGGWLTTELQDRNPIVVVIDGVPQMPGLDPLRMSVGDVREVRRLSASDATTRFGTNMNAGAILVLTKHTAVAATAPIRGPEVPDLEPGPGDHVRLGAGSTLTAVVRWRTADSISVVADGTGELQTLELTSLQRLDVSRGRVPQWDRVLLGGAIGGVMGYLIGSADNRHGDPSPPRETFCLQAGGGASCTAWRDPPAVPEFTLGGVALGGLFAALFVQAERWEPVPIQPAIVSAVWGQRGRLQLGVTVPSR